MQISVVLGCFPEPAEKTITSHVYLCDELYKPVDPVLDIGNFPILLLPTDIIRYIMMDLFTTVKARRLCKELRWRIEPVWQNYKNNTGITPFELYRYINSRLIDTGDVYLYWLKNDNHGGAIWMKNRDNLIAHKDWRGNFNLYDAGFLKYWCLYYTYAKPSLARILKILCKRNISRQAATKIATHELVSTICARTGVALWDWVYLEHYVFDCANYVLSDDNNKKRIFDAIQDYIDTVSNNLECYYFKDNIDPENLRKRITSVHTNTDHDFGNLSYWLKKCKIFVERGYVPKTVILTPSEQFELIKEFITQYSPNPHYISEFKKAMKIS